MFFQTHKGSLQVFRYCSIFKVLCASALRLTTCLLYHRSGFLSSLIFLEAFELSELGHPRSFSEQTGTFQRLLVLFKGFLLSFQKSFFCLSAWRSSIIPYTGPDVNTFLQVFSGFFFFLQNSSSGRPQPLRCGHGRSVSPCQGETKVLYIIYTL